MRNIYTTVAVVFALFLGNTAFGQNNLEKVSNLLKNGDINNLTVQLDEKVEVSVLEADSYTKVEAKDMLDNFFSDKTMSLYVAIHKGNSGNNAYYQIGELRTEKETYRTYFYTKNIDGNFLVQELRIERI